MALCRCCSAFRAGARTPRGRLARAQRARRRRVDGHRLELPTRAPAAATALALRHSQRRRPAQRRPADRVGLVLLRELDYPHIQELFALADTIAHGRRHDDQHHRAATAHSRLRMAGHFNRVVAEAMYENIKQVGCPSGARRINGWRTLCSARSARPTRGSHTKLDTLRPALKPTSATAAARMTSATSRGTYRR